MALTGIVFNIKEFAVHDGPGIRTTVFLKGCPLSCAWCHNPEGISPEPQTLTSAAGTRVVGTEYDSDELSALINSQAEILRMNDGGVTFSGGEPLMQTAFMSEVIDKLNDVHVLLDTSGHARPADFRLIVEKSHLVHFDLKLIDPDQHKKYTGHDNDLILQNLKILPELGTEFIARVPLVPGVTDSAENLTSIADTVSGLKGLLRVELLPYNRAAGGKYAACGLNFVADYDEDQPVNADTSIFEKMGIHVRVC